MRMKGMGRPRLWVDAGWSFLYFWVIASMLFRQLDSSLSLDVIFGGGGQYKVIAAPLSLYTLLFSFRCVKDGNTHTLSLSL